MTKKFNSHKNLTNEKQERKILGKYLYQIKLLQFKCNYNALCAIKKYYFYLKVKN